MKRLFSRGIFAAAVSVFAVFIAGGYALASAKTIRACVAHTNHDIYKHRPCRSGDTKISWNKRGPRGFTGPQGPAGPAGVAGATGVTGASGANGANGASLNNFDATSGPGGTVSLTVGAFTLKDGDTSGSGCTGVVLVDNSGTSYDYANDGATFANFAHGDTQNIALNQGANVFQAALSDGSSGLTGNVGDDTYGTATPYHCLDLGGAAGF